MHESILDRLQSELAEAVGHHDNVMFACGTVPTPGQSKNAIIVEFAQARVNYQNNSNRNALRELCKSFSLDVFGIYGESSRFLTDKIQELIGAFVEVRDEAIQNGLNLSRRVKSFNIPETDEQAIAHTNLVAECWPNSGLDDPVRELGEREFSTWLIIRKSNQKLIEAIDDLEKLTIECRDALDKHEADEAQRAALATSNKISDDAKGRDWIAIWAAWAGSAIATVFGILGYVSGRDAQEEVRQNKHEIVERIGNAEGAEKARDGELRNLLEDHVRKFLIPNTEDNLPSDPNLPPPRTNPPPASQPSNPNPPENLDK